METLEADYLVVGAGAMGMAFTDTLITESDATVILVDRQHQPGGHWNVAYPFVRLHQPSAFYGVNSRALGSNSIDATGWNKGLYELATSGEVCAYFDAVMQQQFLASGRVRYLPMCEHSGDGELRSLVADREYRVRARRIVDATYMHVTVPAQRPPPFEVAEGIHCVPPNELPRLASRFRRFVVVGAGKTGMDACLFLLKHGVDPARIGWVMPRDSWMFDRAMIQPGVLFRESLGRGFAAQTQALAAATSLDDALERVAATGFILRFDPDVWPTMWRCATVTRAELEQLRRIESVIRLGRVERITRDALVLDQGQVPTGVDVLHVDCTADGLERRPVKAVFAGRDITLQSVRTCQQVFSAAFIAHIEASARDEAQKNALCTPVPHPDDNVDFLRTNLGNLRAAARWAEDPELQSWLAHARLDGFSVPEDLALAADPKQAAARAQMQTAAGAAIANLERLLRSVEGAG